MILAKVCILGDFAVGKTSLVRRYVDRQFSDAYLSTVGVKISRKLLTVPGNNTGESLEIQMILWDFEAASAFRPVLASYLQGARAAIVVGDLTRQNTIEAIDGHIERFVSENPRGIVVVALNKADLQHADSLSASAPGDGRAAVRRTVYTSAKTGEGVDRLFQEIGEQILREAVNDSAS